MKAITNLNLLDTDKLLIDDEERIFIVLKTQYTRSDSTCYLELLELTHGFVTYSMTLPIACDRDMNFISPHDKCYTFKFYETEISKEEVSKLLEVLIKERLDKELKKQK